MITVEGPVIHASGLPEEMRIAVADDALTLDAAVERAEKQAILAALRLCNNHRERTAKLLGISVRNRASMSRFSREPWFLRWKRFR